MTRVKSKKKLRPCKDYDAYWSNWFNGGLASEEFWYDLPDEMVAHAVAQGAWVDRRKWRKGGEGE